MNLTILIARFSNVKYRNEGNRFFTFMLGLQANARICVTIKKIYLYIVVRFWHLLSQP